MHHVYTDSCYFAEKIYMYGKKIEKGKKKIICMEKNLRKKTKIYMYGKKNVWQTNLRKHDTLS